MAEVQRAKVAAHKVWLLIGENTGLHQATRKYLESRGQIVLQSTDLNRLSDELPGILNWYDSIDMLIVHDPGKDIQADSLFEKIYTISSCLRKDGNSQIVFMLPNDGCFTRLQHTEAYQRMKQAMKDLAIQVHCFEC